ncbi:hypothetical protein KO561_00805 [Radiobacillus kanasensis]|uniref:hypothetical protein n=1 Tax=Radiobacillus kanasensis TaxID=2844358 RepID=UPI001E282C3E|nr:hypothetical protein [Radiobacillus kanasensis]UFT99553.1 hypothetical protein KO561_00805 [Radiobacillus kanasensis]
MNMKVPDNFNELLKQTGKVAPEEAKKHNTYIIYKKGNQFVREYPNGRISYILYELSREELTSAQLMVF